MGLQKEIWVGDIKEQPIPDSSFVMESTDMSIYVENNKLHLAEAGIEPGVYEDYFVGNENALPTASITDIPSEVVLRTYSTEQTRHRNLQEVELSYDKRRSIVQRHKNAIVKKIHDRAAHAWSPIANDTFNKIITLAPDDSVIDALLELEAFFMDLDITQNLNICLTSEHMKRIKQEDKKLYKDMRAAKGEIFYGFKIHNTSRSPLYTSAGAKKPFASTFVAGDKKASFGWCKDEVFRCFGDLEMYEDLGNPGLQADIISFGQRALTGNIRASQPKYLVAIL
jgi:hypothetical protein